MIIIIESILIAAHDNAIRIHYVKAKVNKTQQNSRFRLYDDRDEIINHMISECSKLTRREYKTIHDWAGKVIHWELCKKYKFDHTNKKYIHSPESVLENETHKLLWYFKKQTEHLISARRPNLVIVNKNKEPTE